MPGRGASGVNAEVDVEVTYLELLASDRADASPARVAFDLTRVPQSDAARVAAEMYRRVGTPWHWTDRRHWTDAEWRDAVERENVEVWTAGIAGEPIGYFQLRVDDDAVELDYFGLLSGHTGKGYGGAMLNAALDRAFALGRSRVTLNTCTLDHPAALRNYLARGFSIVRRMTQRRSISG